MGADDRPIAAADARRALRGRDATERLALDADKSYNLQWHVYNSQCHTTLYRPGSADPGLNRASDQPRPFTPMNRPRDVDLDFLV
jgi:hypothetical protein